MNRHDGSRLRSLLRLYFVMGSVNCRQDPAQVLRQAIRGGITLFQFREKGSGALQGVARFELGKKLRDLCRKHDIPFIVNDDPELMLRLDADGVHIGQEDGRADAVRRKIGAGKIIGVSAHDLEEAEEALRQGADYLGVGPMYPTVTKPDARGVRGPAVIQEIRRRGIVTPLVGIGGIGPGRALSIMEAGADGVAVVSAISQAEDVCGAAQKLREEILLNPLN